MSSTQASIDPVIQWISEQKDIALLLFNGTDTILAANAPAQDLLKFSEAQLRRLGLEALGINEDARLKTLLAAKPGEYSCQIPIRCGDDHQRGFELSAMAYPNRQYLLLLEPIGSERTISDSFREREERYRLALEAAGIGTWDMDINRNETRRSELHDQCFGYPTLQDSWGYDTFLNHVCDEDRERVDQAYQSAMAGGNEYDLRFRVRWPDQSIHWLWSKGRFYLDQDGNPHRVAGIQADVTEEVMLREELRYKATHDHLTGLWNRDHFEVNLAKMIDDCRESGRSLAVLLIDIDHFKRFNDAFNHAGGDEVLKTVAVRLLAAIETDAIAARFGGDEFVVAAPQAPDAEPTDLWLDDLVSALSQPLPLGGGSVKPTVSVGASLFPVHGQDPQELLKAADAAMYEAKRCGRATHRVFDPVTQVTEIDTLMLVDRLPDALETGEIHLYYQPQFEASSQRLIGMEALLRWFPANRPAVPPDVFVRAAEQSGFISELGDWVIREACRQIREWQDLGFTTVPVAINISSVQFMRGELVRGIKRHLDEFGLTGACLEVEITETVALDNLESALSQLHELRGMGIGIAIDDFGTGFSSLNYLRYFPINRIKIDRSFVNGCLDIQESAAICKTINALGHNLGCRVIAEGVEYPEQLDFLVRQGCQEIQGYLFSKPLSAADAARFLEREAQREQMPGRAARVDPGPESSDEALRQRSVDAAMKAIAADYPKYHRIVEMAARSMNVPMASLNLIEADKVAAVVAFGLKPGLFDRSTALCDHTIRQLEVMEVSDTRAHPHFRHSPGVEDPLGIQFYAGLGILAPGNQVIGTICLFDRKPRELSQLERDSLTHFGAMIETELARALHDPRQDMIQARSRRDFNLYFRDYWHSAARSGAELSLIWIGIDQLKQINVQNGIEVGDQCLHQVLSVVSRFALDQGKLKVFRMEGDTIALLCRDGSPARSKELVADLKQRLQTEATTGADDRLFAFTLTYGVQSAPSNGTIAGMDQMLRQSRQALQLAKAAGKNQIHTVAKLGPA